MNYVDIKEDDLDEIPTQLNLENSDAKEDALYTLTNFLKKYYSNQIDSILLGKLDTLVIDISKLESFNIKLHSEFLINTDGIITLIRSIIDTTVNPFIEDEHTGNKNKYKIKFDNIPLGKVKPIKEVNVNHINKLISVEGLVRQYTLLIPREYKRYYQCEDCNAIVGLEQNDFELKKLKSCTCGCKKLYLLEDKTEYINSQKIRIQESLDNLEAGEIAHFLDILIDEDKINNFSVGEKVVFTGKYQIKENKKETFKEPYLKAIDVANTKDDFYNMEVTKEDILKIKELSKRKDIFTLFSESLAPHICGYQNVKKGIALQMVGGNEDTERDGIQRSNIHILLLGDPGLGKSEFLLSTSKLSPKSIYTAGRTTSGVGLVGAVCKDDFSGNQWSIRPGALVLGNNGIVMIDEFDKMDEEERSALHECMAQGTVTISKAGINQTMNAKVSILAAANPKYSKYDPNKSFVDQANITPSLLSRFDLFYLLKDNLPIEEERAIAEGMINFHAKEKIEKEIIEADLLRKYIAYSKTISPTMSDKLNSNILDFYLKVKQASDKTGSPSIFRRFIPTIVRLAEAHARLCLSSKVRKKDVEVAKAILADSLREVILDVENDDVDVNMLYIGKSNKELDKYKIVNDFIGNNNDCEFRDILDDVSNYYITKEKLSDILNDMELKGDIYKPKAGIYRLKGE